MCRLFAVTSEEPLSPMMAMQALDVMREGHDGSGVGLFLSDLGGPFEELKGAPILSGIFTNDGLKRLDQFMMNIGFHDQIQAFDQDSQEPASRDSPARYLPDPRL